MSGTGPGYRAVLILRILLHQALESMDYAARERPLVLDLMKLGPRPYALRNQLRAPTFLVQTAWSSGSRVFDFAGTEAELPFFEALLAFAEATLPCIDAMLAFMLMRCHLWRQSAMLRGKSDP